MTSFVTYHVFENNETSLGLHIRHWAGVRRERVGSESFELKVGWTYLGTRTFPDQGSPNANKAFLHTLLTQERGLGSLGSSVNPLLTVIGLGLCLAGCLVGAYLLGKKQRPSEAVKSLMEEAKMSFKTFAKPLQELVSPPGGLKGTSPVGATPM